MSSHTTITGSANSSAARFEPHNAEIVPVKIVPQIAPIEFIEATNEICSFVNGPLASGVSFDRS